MKRYLSRLVKIFTYAIKTGKGAFCLLFVAAIAHGLRSVPRFRGYWLVAERHDEARDNGYHFYRYLKHNQPNVRAFYVIVPSAPDAARVARVGPVVAAGEWKHYLYYALSEVAIGTDEYGASPDPRAAKFLRRLLPRKLVVLIGHGIRKDHLSRYENRHNKVGLLCCGALPEFRYLKNMGGYAEHALVYTGLARYDALLHAGASRRRILIMPTFRKWLYELSLLPAPMRSEAFQREVFYKEFQSLLNSTKLVDLLSVFDLDLVFFPHYRVQPFIGEFITTSNRIILARREACDIQALLMESKLLITDYSSVFFDFAYMHKPVIYFQFDVGDYRKHHYKEGFFSYDRDGFGPVVDNAEDVVRAVQSACASDFLVPNKYRARMEKFFSLRDGNNCERIYRAIRRSLEFFPNASK